MGKGWFSDSGNGDDAMSYSDYLPEEIESRGEQIYDEHIRASVEAGNEGKYVVIDIESGDFEMDEDDLQATKRMLAKQPGAVLYGLRVGYPTAYTLGGHTATHEQ